MIHSTAVPRIARFIARQKNWHGGNRAVLLRSLWLRHSGKRVNRAKPWTSRLSRWQSRTRSESGKPLLATVAISKSPLPVDVRLMFSVAT